ncbi:hypothetical protein FQR65_LT14374 [Abscondita terminalis]|nr:hypothetical protein FQR65_LT14374 [Abscondita terminalis]
MSKNEEGKIEIPEIFKKFRLKNKEILFISQVTCGQNQNAMWHQMRQGRLTASNFGVVLNACKIEKYPPSLFKRLLGKVHLDGVKSIEWGLNH